MSTHFVRVTLAALFFVLIFASGVWVKSTGMPYSAVALNIHKFISLAAAVFLGITVYQVNRAAGLSGIEWTAIVLAGIFLIASIVSGGLTSIDTMPRFVLRIHQVSLALGAVFSAATLFLIVRGK